MAGQETLTSHLDELDQPKKRGHRKERNSKRGRFKQLSDRTPLRTKLIAAVLILVIMALCAIGVTSIYQLRRYVTTQNDTTLTGALHQLYHESLPPTGYAEPFAMGSQLIVAIQPAGQQVSWLTEQGTHAFGGPEFNESLPELPTGTGWAGSANTNSTKLITVSSKSGPDSWRVIAQSGTDQNTGQVVTLVVAMPLGNLNALTQQLVIFDLIVGGAIVLVLAAVGAAVVQANLRPLNDIELTAGQIAAGHLDHRVPEGDPRTEIGSLGRSLNAMLTQIETAFHAQGEAEQSAHESEERMRRFIADAAHELRTPLTTIRGFAAHYRQRGGASRLRVGARHGAGRAAGEEQSPWSRTETAFSAPAGGSAGGGVTQEGISPEELDHLMGRVESEATRMGMLVEDLLTLARLDQQRPLNFAPVDLLTLAVDAVQDARIVSPGRPIDLVVAPGTAFLVNGDEARLRQVLANLVNNAITHTPAGTPIRVKIGRGSLESHGAEGDDGRADIPRQGDWGGSVGFIGGAGAGRPVVPAVVLDVEDEGPGMTTEQAQRVFERFYRADAARNRASGGSGLGLAIVAGLVSAHGGTVSVRTAPRQGADFQVKLPLSPDALAIDDPDDA